MCRRAALSQRWDQPKHLVKNEEQLKQATFVSPQPLESQSSRSQPGSLCFTMTQHLAGPKSLEIAFWNFWDCEPYKQIKTCKISYLKNKINSFVIPNSLEDFGRFLAICPGTLRDPISHLHRNLPEPHQPSAPEPSGTFSGTWCCSCTGSHQSYSGLKTP